MKVIYIADDGTQFNDEYECEDYEFNQRFFSDIFKVGILFLNREKHIMGFPTNYDELDDIYQTCEYVYISSEMGSEWMKQVNKECGLYFPTEVGKWHFNGDLFSVNVWERIEE